MSECDVVARLGQPTAVNIGKNPGGERTVALTFQGGPRPGVYRFAGGRLDEMDRVEMPAAQAAAPVPAKKKMVKKKPDKTKGQPKPTTRPSQRPDNVEDVRSSDTRSGIRAV